MAVSDVERAKADLEAQGQKWETSCDAFKITNLVASRMGLKLVEKLSGDRCMDRKVDGIIENGHWFDILRNAGPPLNENIPAWQDQGPVGNLVAKDPFPVDEPGPGPDPNPGDLPARVEALETLTTQQTAAIKQLDERVRALESIAGNISSLRFNLEGVQLKLSPVEDQ